MSSLGISTTDAIVTMLSKRINELDSSSFEKYYINFDKRVSDYNDLIEIVYNHRDSIYPNFLNIRADTDQCIAEMPRVALLIQYQLYPITTNFHPPPENFTNPLEIKNPSAGIFRIYFNKDLFGKINLCRNRRKMIIPIDVGLFDVKTSEKHANLIVLDLEMNVLVRYEPHGSIIADPIDQLFRVDVTKKISEELKIQLRYDNLRSCKLSGLQTLENKCDVPKMKWEHGYCHAWTTLYQYVLMKQNITANIYEKYIMALIWLKFPTKINDDAHLGCLLRDMIKIFNLYMNEYGEKALMDSIENRNLGRAMKIVRYGNTLVSIQSFDIAIKNNDSGLVEFLLETGIKPSSHNLGTAIKEFRNISKYAHTEKQLNENYKIIKLLVTKVDVNEHSHGSSLIELASANRYWNAVKLLIGHNANVNNYVEDSPMYYAIVANNNEIIDLLLQNGAVVNYRLLKLSVWMDKAVIKKMLDTDVRVEPEILFAADRNWDIFELLLDRIGSVNVINWIGQTPLLMVLKDKHGPSINIIDKLIKKDRDLNYASNPPWLLDARHKYESLSGMKAPELIDTPLSLALQHRHDVIPLLIRSGTDINYKDKHGDTLLHRYVYDPGKIELLLAYGADKTIVNNLDETPLDLAVKGKYDKTILLLKSQSGGNYYSIYMRCMRRYIELKNMRRL